MAIKKIKVSNFKTFKDLDLELGSFNVVIGANASGKSNFTQIFRFLRDAEDNDLKNAVSIHGGLDYLCNLNAKASEELIFDILLDKKATRRGLEKDYRFDFYDLQYTFSLKRDKSKLGFAITSDKLTQKIKLTKSHDRKGKLFDETKAPEEGTFTVSKEKKEISFDIKPSKLAEKLCSKEGLHGRPVFPFTRHREGKFTSSANTLLIREPYISFIMPRRISFFKNTAIYDLDPRKAKNPAKITGKAELEEDGNNLAIILNNIIENEDERRKLCNLVKDLLPFVKEVGTEKFAEKSLMITLQEDYYEDKNLRADLLSDGTVNITALIVALYFEEKDVVIIEEPERNIHPHLISRVVEMMKEASKKKQIIVTTHSPEVVKHAGLDNLLLISRDNNGFSHISRPKERKEIKVFLENELGLDELYVQNLLTD